VLPRRAAKSAALLSPLQGRALWLAGGVEMIAYLRWVMCLCVYTVLYGVT
jgi:hypothetical protein